MTSVGHSLRQVQGTLTTTKKLGLHAVTDNNAVTKSYQQRVCVCQVWESKPDYLLKKHKREHGGLCCIGQYCT